MKSTHLTLVIILLMIAVFISILTIWWGYASWDIVWQGIIDYYKTSSRGWNPVLHERLPRLIVLFCTGAALSVSGVVMQSVFRNVLASPGILGINAGGSLLAMIVFITSWHLYFPYLVPIMAFIGCLSMLIVVYCFSVYIGDAQSSTLLFVGIAFSTVLVAIEGTITYALRSNWQVVQTIVEWQAGTTMDRGWQHVHMQLPLTIVGIFGVLAYAKEINLFTLGEDDARNLGMNVNAVRWRLFLFVAMLTGGSMAVVGTIPFFGLILPHVMRKLVGPNHCILIPFCILGGAVTLASLDLILKMMEIDCLSIGNVCSIVGGVFFLSLLIIHRKQWRIAC